MYMYLSRLGDCQFHTLVRNSLSSYIVSTKFYYISFHMYLQETLAIRYGSISPQKWHCSPLKKVVCFWCFGIQHSVWDVGCYLSLLPWDQTLWMIHWGRMLANNQSITFQTSYPLSDLPSLGTPWICPGRFECPTNTPGYSGCVWRSGVLSTKCFQVRPIWIFCMGDPSHHSLTSIYKYLVKHPVLKGKPLI